MPRLISDDELERLAVIANATMNRGRGIEGVNSYQRELRLDIVSFFAERQGARWLDLCCGSARALLEAGRQIGASVSILGLDLVPMFEAIPGDLPSVVLKEQSLSRWEPAETYDLITCVHGLHYLGDKLAVIRRAVGALTEEGLFVGNLDLDNLRDLDGESLRRALTRHLRPQGVGYDHRKHLVSCHGRREVEFPYRYLGADPEAGANYTKQPVADSYYEEA